MMIRAFNQVSAVFALCCVGVLGAAPTVCAQQDAQDGAKMQGLEQNSAPADIGAMVALRAADKVTGQTQDILVETGVMQRFGQLEINAMTCTKAPPEELPESTAFLQIDEVTSEGDRARIFSGWMFASTPALNALEHPVYDLWVTDCMISDGVDAAGSR